MLHNHVSERCDLVACGVHCRILYCCRACLLSWHPPSRPVFSAFARPPLRGCVRRPPTTLHNINAGSQGGGRMSEKSSLLSDDAASSLSEDVSTTAGCKEVMCVRRAYANSQHRGVVSCTHLRRSLCRIWGGGFPRTSRVVSSAEKEASEGGKVE